MPSKTADRPPALAAIIRSLPRDVLTKSPWRAWGTLVADFLLIAALAAVIVAVDSWWLASIPSLLLGCVLTGLFVVGHDAGHRAFSDSKLVNDVVGHLTLPWLFWPYDVWRASHDHHHKWTHHADHEIAWRPLTRVEFLALPAWKRRVYAWTRTSLFFWASLLFQAFAIKDAVTGRGFPKATGRRLSSLAIAALVAVVYVGGAWRLAGAYGLVFLVLVPQLVFQFWLSVFTLFHHTSPENELLSADEWTPEVAQLCRSIHVRFPAFVDRLTHDIAWHVPHHVCPAIPHYRLRAAHAALKAKYPSHVVERDLTWAYVKAVTSTCQLMESTAPREQGWLRAAEASSQQVAAPVDALDRRLGGA